MSEEHTSLTLDLCRPIAAKIYRISPEAVTDEQLRTIRNMVTFGVRYGLSEEAARNVLRSYYPRPEPRTEA